MPRTATATPSKEILEAALQGLEIQKQRLDEQIEQVRSLMGKRSAGRPPKTSTPAASTASQESSGRGGRKRTLSAEARKRIAAAQKKRWANFRKSQQ
jgi:hypothetical protein